MGKYVGIDLGTTYSAVAYINDDGMPQIIPNDNGKNTTPSTLLFDGNSIVVGEAAKNEGFSDPDNYEAFVKRHMGERDYYFTTTDGTRYTPEEVSAIILKKLKNDAEASLGEEISGAVITVPAYFNDAQRTATMDAAAMAKINVLAIINEPTAAALAFGISKGKQEKQTVLIYDLGGGTFDVCIMRFTDKEIVSLAGEGSRTLGGYDFDNKIVKYVLEKAEEQGIDVASDAFAMQDLLMKAEQAKCVLSVKDKTNIMINVQGKPLKVAITREEFDEMIEPLLYRTISVMENAMEEAGLEYSEVDKILLVGGSTRIPYVREMIEDETGIKPSTEVHPDEAVAIGAAFHALEMARNKANEESVEVKEEILNSLPTSKNQYQFQDVTAHGIGVISISEYNEKMNSVILPKNSPIPSEGYSEFSTVEPYQESLIIEVTQGEDENPRYVTIIGTSELKIRPKPQRIPIRVRIGCDKDSIIHVRVTDLSDNEDLGEMRIDRIANLTEEEVKENTEKIESLNISGE